MLSPSHQRPKGLCDGRVTSRVSVTLADEIELPFADLSIDRLLIVHAAEYSEHQRAMMREACAFYRETVGCSSSHQTVEVFGRVSRRPLSVTDTPIVPGS